MSKSLKVGIIIALGVVSTLPAQAEIDDAPYFNLWAEDPDAPPSNGSDGTQVALCGLADCSGGPTSSAFGIFRVATVEPIIPAGSGYIDPFLRFQHNEGAFTGSNTFEAAFNTNSSPNIGTITNPDAGVAGSSPDNSLPGTFDNMAKDIDAGGEDFNHAIRLGDLVIDADGFFTFRLDVNEPGGSKSTIRLDELQLFMSNNGSLTDYTMDTHGKIGAATQLDDASTGQLADATKIWDMDFNQQAGGTKKGGQEIGGVLLDSVLTSGPSNGSGDFDMDLLLSAELFGYEKVNGQWKYTGKGVSADFSEDSWVYLYNFMGGVDKMDDPSQAGFEEWAAVVTNEPPPPDGGGGGVPEPGTAFLMMIGLAGMIRAGKAAKGIG
ncbi:MAG: PEP-CTERM sorting domain-containing protein [Gammaproteobacteria bacterium]